MAGHSKWANIKHKKAANDSKRSGIFSKMSRIITSAVHEGGKITDPEKNFRLRLAIERAKSVNMAKDTIQRAIDKAGGGDGALLKEALYEGFGPGGTALLISTTTDNTNRTLGEVKQVLAKQGGKIGSHNSVAYLFQKCGVVEFDKEKIDEATVFEFFDKIDGIDLEDADTSYIVFIPFDNIGKVKDILPDTETKTLDIYYKPTTETALNSTEEEKLNNLVDQLEDLDDVLNVYTNAQ